MAKHVYGEIRAIHSTNQTLHIETEFSIFRNVHKQITFITLHHRVVFKFYAKNVSLDL